jgi:outer membrane protein OmpA-like peptidoglycan-associated protein
MNRQPITLMSPMSRLPRVSTPGAAVPRSRLPGVIALVALATLAACASGPPMHAGLEAARADYGTLKQDPQLVARAPLALQEAGDALARADKALTRGDDRAEVDHLTYLATGRIAIAREVGRRGTAEQAVADAADQRQRQQLQGRTDEADSARRQAEASRQDAEMAARMTADARRDAAASAERAEALRLQIVALDARPTERGMVVTIGDLLFGSGRAVLQAGALPSIDRLAAFLQQNPGQSAMIEGFTDSVGATDSNQRLSEARAEAVRQALMVRGVGGDRLTAQGLGEAYPVAANDSDAGRQSNRRVEILLSADGAAAMRRR